MNVAFTIDIAGNTRKTAAMHQQLVPITQTVHLFWWRSVLLWPATCKKVPNVLSRCHTKIRMGARGRAHPSFGMTTTFQKRKEKKKNFKKKKKKKLVSYQKVGGRCHERPSFFWYVKDSGHKDFLRDAALIEINHSRPCSHCTMR